MKALIDKIKSFIEKTDKRVLIGIGAGVVCLIAVIIIIIVAVAGSGDKDNEDNLTTAEKTTVESSTKDSESQKETTKKDDESTDDAEETSSEEDSSDVTTESGSENKSDNQTTTKPSQVTTKPSSGNSTENTTTQNTEQTTTPAPPQDGESGTTHMEFPDENLSVTTVGIAAGKSVHYDIYRVGGMILEINSVDACVVYDGKTYKPQNGVVKVKIEYVMASDAVGFDIINNGSSKNSFKLQFKQIVGTHDKPEKLTSVAGKHDAYLEADNDQGYNYLYTAERTGTIVFYVSSVSSSTKNASAKISVTNNNNFANITTDADGVADGQGYIKIEMNVTQGDVLRIVVSTQPNSKWKYPEATVTWVAEYK